MREVKRCADCDARLTAGNSVPDGAGRARGRCRACFNEWRKDHRTDNAQKATGMPPGRPPKGTSVAPDPRGEHRLKRQVEALTSTNKQLLSDLDRADATRDLREAARAAREKVKPIAPRERAGGKLREATALALASDWHVEERVLPEQVAGRNRYDLSISRRRMERYFEAVRWATDFNRQAFVIRDLVLWLGGDLITGHIHPDNAESNYLAPPKALAYARVHVAAGIRSLLADPGLERITVVCNDGNHGRMSEKMRAATRTDQSLEWLLYSTLAAEFADEPRLRWLIAEGPLEHLQVYGRTVRFMHGDSINYQGGVGGVTIPIYKALGRLDTVRRADLTVMGHFHQYHDLRDLLVNGSLIGYNTYAMSKGFRFEAPCQAYKVLDPLRFGSVSVPLWVSDRADDAG